MRGRTKLFRTWYPTDVDDGDPEYVGTWSGEIPDNEDRGWTIVGVDWSQRGQVEVTYLIPA
jgi:hypothetical protein